MSESLSTHEKRALHAIRLDRLLDTLSDLVAIPSVANEETPAQERVAREMEEIGLSTDVWEIDFERLKRHPAYSADMERHEGLGVVGTVTGTDSHGPTLVLNGHVDVVPAGDPTRWSSSPWTLTEREGRVYGRGAVDMKGALCCALAAARAIRDAEVELRGSLQIQSVIGEEDGGAGTLATLERGHTGDGAIVLEPTLMVVAPAQAGALSFRLTVPGRAAHGALREEGVDPVEKFVPIFQRLRALEADRNAHVADPLFASDTLPFALCMGRLRAGIWPSTVAEELVCEGRYGVAPDEDLTVARSALESAVAEAGRADAWLRDHPPRVEWVGAQFAPARTAADDPIVTAVAGAYVAVTGEPASLGGMRFGADMRLLVNQGGIPTVLFGPGDVREAHRPDESIAVADLLTATRALVVTALRFCVVAGDDQAAAVPPA